MGSLLDPAGRSNRLDYLGALLVCLCFYGAGIMMLVMEQATRGQAAFWTFWSFVGSAILFAASLYLSWTAHIRRLHDLGRSGWWVLLLLAPAVNLFFPIYLLTAPGKPSDTVLLTRPQEPAALHPHMTRGATVALVGLVSAAVLIMFVTSTVWFWLHVPWASTIGKPTLIPAANPSTTITLASKVGTSIGSSVGSGGGPVKIFGCNAYSNMAVQQLAAQGAQAVQELTVYLNSPDPCISDLAIWALASVGTPAALDALQQRQSNLGNRDEMLSVAIKHLNSGLQANWEALIVKVDYYQRPERVSAGKSPAGTLSQGTLLRVTSLVRSETGEVGARGEDQKYYEVLIKDSGDTVYVPVPSDDYPIFIWRSRALAER